jgi:hypothetical protein
MRKSLVSIVVSASKCTSYGCIIAAMLAFSSPAKALVVYAGVSADPNSPFATTFDGVPSLSTGPFTGPYTQLGSDLTFTGTNAQILNTTGASGAEPFGDTSNYLSVLGGGSATVTVNNGSVNTVSFLWGSIDAYNTIQFFNGATLIGTFTGSNILPKLSTGCQQSPDCTGYVTFTDSNEAITSFVMTSTTNSFETDDFLATQVGTAPVPEISTWAMMILGFLGIGLVGYRRTGLRFRFV